MSEDPSWDDGGDDEDGEEESKGEFGTSLVLRVVSWRSESAGRKEKQGKDDDQRRFGTNVV